MLKFRYLYGPLLLHADIAGLQLHGWTGYAGFSKVYSVIIGG